MAQALTTSGALVTNPSNALPKSAADMDLAGDHSAAYKAGSVNIAVTVAPQGPVKAQTASQTASQKASQAASYSKAQVAALQNTTGAMSVVVRDQQGKVITTTQPSLVPSTQRVLAPAPNVQVAQVKAPQYNYTWMLVLLILIILIIAFIVSYKNKTYANYNNYNRGMYRMY